MNTIGPMPRHLKRFSWYAPHQAWLAEKGLPHHEFPEGTEAVRADLRRANLSGADLREARLCEACLLQVDLSATDLRAADLSETNLRHVSLRKADLSGCIGLPAAPIVEGLDRKVYEAVTDGGSLEMDIWHSCETVHCRGGWAIHFAGESGKELCRVYGPSVAAALIYHASTGRVPDFYATNEDAMADIKKCAGVTLDSTCPGKMGGGR